MKYRSEIDGLRAVAVVPVILFHAGLDSIPGGFLGVDVFFVISGFLITSIIHQDVSAGMFRISTFYERRIRRILPALTVVILLCVPFAYFTMIPDDLKKFGESAVASIFFSNNILLYITGNYFDIEAKFKPLIHTWSLGIEEQYYIFIPFIIFILGINFGRIGVLVGLSVLTIISFVTCIHLSYLDQVGNFYLISSRFWELGVGSICAVLPKSVLHKFKFNGFGDWLGVIGLSAIVLPMVFIGGQVSNLPGWPSLLPVRGSTCVILFSSRENCWAGRILSTGPFRGIGLISYSAYLYHQPVFAFARIVLIDEPSIILMIALIVPVFGLAYLSWRFVEQPFRSRARISTRSVLAFTATGGAITAALGFVFFATSGFYRSWPELAGEDIWLGQTRAYNMSVMRFRDVALDPKSPAPNVLVFGNSFARDIINMGLASGRMQGHNISYSDIGDCSFPMPPNVTSNAKAADYVILGSGVSKKNVDCTARRVQEIHNISHAKLVVMGTKNFGANNNAVMMLDKSRRYYYHAMPITSVVEDNRVAKSNFDTSLYVDIIGAIADRDGKVPVFTPDKKFISQDRTHLTKAGASFLGPIVFNQSAFRDFDAVTAR